MIYRNFIRMVGCLLLMAVVVTAFHSSRKRIEATVDDAFKQAIEQDYQNRKSYFTRNTLMNRLSDPARDYALSVSTNRKIGSYSLRTRSGILTYQFKDSVNEEVAKRLLNQHLMDEICKLNPSQLKTIFQQRLKEKNMEMPVGVLCLRESQRYWSEADSIVPEDAYSTSRQVLDIAGKIKVQAWADYDTALLFRHLDPVVYVLLLLMTGMLMWIWPSRKKSVEEMEETTEEIPQGIRIDHEKQELTIDGVSCSIAKLDLQLLSILCERQGECLTREEIKHKFWPTDDNAGEKIDTHIKTIRKMLKDFPRYQVVTVRGKGYYLQEIK